MSVIDQVSARLSAIVSDIGLKETVDHSLYKPLIYMSLYAGLMAGLWALIRYLSSLYDPTVIVFYRTAFGVLFLTPYLIKNRQALFQARDKKLLVLRGILSVIALFALVYAVSLAPLADVTAISYLAPILASGGAVLFFKDRPTRAVLISLAMGFVGMVFIIQPSAIASMVDEFSSGQEIMTISYLGLIFAVIAAISIAGGHLVIKRLGGQQRSGLVAAFPFLFVLPFSFLIALPKLVLPRGVDLAIFVIVGASAVATQFVLSEALKSAPASKVMPYDFLRLLMTAALGVFVFSDRLTWTTLVGASIIFTASLIVFRCKSSPSLSATQSAPEKIHDGPGKDQAPSGGVL